MAAQTVEGVETNYTNCLNEISLGPQTDLPDEGSSYNNPGFGPRSGEVAVPCPGTSPDRLGSSSSSSAKKSRSTREREKRVKAKPTLINLNMSNLKKWEKLIGL